MNFLLGLKKLFLSLVAVILPSGKPAVDYGVEFGPVNPMNIEQAAFELAKQKIIAAEGRRNDVYKDSRGILTVGIGHRVTAADNLKFGQRISDASVDALFNRDFGAAFNAAKLQAAELGKYTPRMIAALASVNFQLGTGWRSKLYNTWLLLKGRNIPKAIRHLEASAWADQTPNRVAAFIDAIEAEYA